MILLPRFENICQDARKHADIFSVHFLSKTANFDLADGSLSDFRDARRVIHKELGLLHQLTLFSDAVFGLQPFRWQKPSPVPGFGSWLVSGQSAYRIALYQDQLTNWEQMSGIPTETLRIRSVVHEIAHFHLHYKPVWDTPAGAGDRRIPSVTKEEEEEAWVYTFVFLGILVGDYSLQSRTKKPPTDESARVAV